tara:strand:+ start:750 stop:947 length:198 start_codon:yes stop_codon:yes gene_type:complete
MKKRKYKRPYPNNPKLDILDKKIPMNLSIQRKVVLDFNKTCESMGVSQNEIAQELFLEFLLDTKN